MNENSALHSVSSVMEKWLTVFLCFMFCCYLCVMYFSEDILVFLTGQEEIESVVKSVRDISHDLPAGIYAVPEFFVIS